MRDDDRVAAFPGYGHSDRIIAEAAFCVGTFSQACLAVERAPEPARREISDNPVRIEPGNEGRTGYSTGFAYGHQ